METITVSGKFRPSGKRIAIISNTETYTVKDHIEQWIVPVEKGGKFFFTDSHILSHLGEAVFTGERFHTEVGQVQHFDTVMTHEEVIAEAERQDIYKEYHIVEALRFGGELVTLGEIPPGTRVFFYLSNIVDGQKQRLSVYVRVTDGLAGVDLCPVSANTSLKTTNGAFLPVNDLPVNDAAFLDI